MTSDRRITPTPETLEILTRIRNLCGFRDLQSALDILSHIKGRQLIAQLEVISHSDPEILNNLTAIGDSIPQATAPTTLPLDEPPSFDSLL